MSKVIRSLIDNTHCPKCGSYGIEYSQYFKEYYCCKCGYKW